MPFITQGKTNLQFISIVIVLGVLVGGGILSYYYWWIADLETKLAELELRVPEVKTQKEVPIDETVNWKTYRNEEYGFEFGYPDDLVVEVSPYNSSSISLKSRLEKETCFQLGFSCPVAFEVIPNPDSLPIQDLYESIGGIYPESDAVYGGINDVIVSGRQGTRLSNIFRTGEDLIFIPLDGNVLKMYLSQQDQLDEVKIQENLDTFNQIFSTLKFIE